MPALHEVSLEEELARLRRGVAAELPRDGLKEKLALSRRERRPLRIKFGVDPNTPDLHLGHTVPLRKLKTFQDLGHTVTFLIGDFTARIGDPTGRTTTRPALSVAQVRANAETYLAQVWRILDRERTDVRYNSEWSDPMPFSEVIRLASKYTVAQLLDRDDFSARYKGGRPIAVHEFLYPLIQGYDSVALKADVELCSTDQIFNCHVARVLQEDVGQPPEAILAMPLLEGTDGVKKMSKSAPEHAIGIAESADEMYGKILSVPDALVPRYVELLLDGALPADLPPRDAKHALARAIVERYHGAEGARAAAERFERVFVRHEAPADIAEVGLDRAYLKEGSMWIVKLLRQVTPKDALVPSMNEARRLVEQGAVELDGKAVADPMAEVTVRDGVVIKIGKRRFARVRLVG